MIGNKQKQSKLSRPISADERKMNNKIRILFVAYIAFMVWFTLLYDRPQIAERRYNLELFWSYRMLLCGEDNGLKMVIQNIGNIVFFVPFGFLFSVLERKKQMDHLLIFIGFLFSGCIELLQFFFCVGLAEIDDIICNTLGTAIGSYFYTFFHSRLIKYGYGIQNHN